MDISFHPHQQWLNHGVETPQLARIGHQYWPVLTTDVCVS
jgi:hypothetical protein